MLERYPLGSTGIEVSRLGLGISGPLGSHILADEQVVALIRAAMSNGINLFDTAPFYGIAEARLGRALSVFERGTYCIVSKVGKRRRGHNLIANFSEAAIRADCERSLTNLGVSYIDVLLLHGALLSDIENGAERALCALLEEKLVRAIGVCGHAPELNQALERDFVQVLQAPAAMADDLAAHIAATGRALIVNRTMRSAVRDLRAPRRPSDLWYIARGVIRPQGTASGEPSAALAKSLAHPAVHCALMTTTRMTHLAQNIAVARALAGAATRAP